MAWYLVRSPGCDKHIAVVKSRRPSGDYNSIKGPYTEGQVDKLLHGDRRRKTRVTRGNSVSAYGDARRAGRVFLVSYRAPNIGTRYAAIKGAASQAEAAARLKDALGGRIKIVAARRAGERDIPSHYRALPRTDGILVPVRFAEKRKPARRHKKK